MRHEAYLKGTHQDVIESFSGIEQQLVKRPVEE